ncbi:phosphoheptose isomerase [Alphaproteobacteria bacterium]|nr:phosphoheptose isomerase [Alphaproteobacteria bacterium]
MKYCFDLDNTLCTTIDGNYKESQPKELAIKKVNDLFNNGHTIIIFTARYMGRMDGNISKVYEGIYALTKKQLSDWRVNYHELILGKPEFDVLIDDKSFNYSDSWIEEIK